MEAESRFSRFIRTWKMRLLGQQVTVYPTYGYQVSPTAGEWLAPVRVWVHDNRDTPFVEGALQNKLAHHFEEDLQRPLTEAERARLEKTLTHFIADDKNGEAVEFRFVDDLYERVFTFAGRTSHNGVLEETFRFPQDLVDDLYRRSTDGDRWLEIHARTTDGLGEGRGFIRFLAPEGLSVISDIDDTIKVTHVPAGKKTVLRNTFLKEFQAAQGMRERYVQMVQDAGPTADVCFHYISGSPWQMYSHLSEFLLGQELFPGGTFHMKDLRLNVLEAGALGSMRSFALTGDLATLEQKIRQITNLMIHLPKRRFILVGDSGEKDPEVYRAIQRLFPKQVEKILIRDVLGERLAGMERITGDDVAVFLDTSHLEKEMTELVAQAAFHQGNGPKL